MSDSIDSRRRRAQKALEEYIPRESGTHDEPEDTDEAGYKKPRVPPRRRPAKRRGESPEVDWYMKVVPPEIVS